MSAALKPIENVNLRSRIAAQLREAIYKGEFRPGESIPEASVANQLQVSRAPVREALLLLEKEGLVTVQANRGAVIRSLTPDELADIMSLRYRLESWALELARPRITPEILTKLNELYTTMVAAARGGDVRGFTNADFAFHRLLWETTGHPLLAETLLRISGPVFAFADIALSQAAFDCTRLAELHKPVLACLAGESDQRPEEALREVFDYAFQHEWDVLFLNKSEG